MRLINTTTLEFAPEDSDAENEPYAIVSHRWGKDEVTYEHHNRQWPKPGTGLGWDKIVQGCRLARLQSIPLNWLWIDT